MNEETNKFKKDIGGMKMTEDEKIRMKNVVFAHVANNPLAKKAEIFESPYARFFKWHFTGGAVAAFSVAAFFILAGVTSGVAENALPGDTLYPIKVNVNEQLVKGLSFGNEAKARAYASIAERRLVEIEQLTIEEKTENRGSNQKVIAELNEDFIEHAEEVHNYVAKIEEEGNIGDAIEVAATFETTLSTHSEILAEVSAEVPEIIEPGIVSVPFATSTEQVDDSEPMAITTITESATSTEPLATSTEDIASTTASTTATTASSTPTNISDIMVELKSQGDKADATALKLVDSVASSTATSSLKIVIEKIEAITEKKIDELEDAIEDIRDADLEIEYAEEIKKFEEAHETLMEAKDMKNENIKEAIRLNKEANKAAHEAIVLIKTQQALEINLENKE